MLLDCLLKLSYLAFAKRLHHVVQPFKVSSFKRVDDIFVKQLGDVKDILAEQDGHTHFDRKLSLLLFTQLILGCVRQILQTTLVIVLVIIFSFVVETKHVCKR